MFEKASGDPFSSFDCTDALLPLAEFGVACRLVWPHVKNLIYKWAIISEESKESLHLSHCLGSVNLEC